MPRISLGLTSDMMYNVRGRISDQQIFMNICMLKSVFSKVRFNLLPSKVTQQQVDIVKREVIAFLGNKHFVTEHLPRLSKNFVASNQARFLQKEASLSC